MKRFCIILLILFITGCASGEKVTCNINGKKALFTIKNGIITSYKVEGENISRREIDEINGEYFTSAKDNKEGKDALKTYINTLGGTCNYD